MTVIAKINIYHERNGLVERSDGFRVISLK
jgi:hypothetical protein